MHVISLLRSVGRLIRHGNVYHPGGVAKSLPENQREIYKRSTCSSALKTIVLLTFLSRFPCENAIDTLNDTEVT